MSDGVLYVEILPSTKGIGKAVEKDVSGAFAGAEKSSSGFFAKVGKGLKWASVGVAAIGTTVAALAVKGGITRALNIEDAQAKLKGLGHDTKSVDAIMTNALASVKGTAFGLDAAATTAAAAVASGIKPGQELERYLRLTADAATIAGVSMEEMGSIVNKVQAKGKAQMEDLNRLTERGIPILQMLADEYGVTAEEMSKMVSKGEVDAERFRKALEDNVGGAALESGNTTRGAFANMMAALSRLGLVFVEDALGGAKTFFNEVTIILDGLADRFRPWVQRVKESLSEAFTLDGMGERFLAGFDGALEAVRNGPIPKLLAAVAPIVPALSDMAAQIGGALGSAFSDLGAALAPVLPLLAETLTDAIVQLAPSFGDLVVALLPLLPSLVELAAALVPLAKVMLELLVPAVAALVDWFAPMIEMVSDFISMLAGNKSFDEFMSGLDSLSGSFGALVQSVMDVAFELGTFLGHIVAFGEAVWEIVVAAFNGIRDFFASVWESIGLVIGGALEIIVGLVTGNMQLVQAGIQQALGAILAWWSSAWATVSAVVAGAWTSVSSTVSNGVRNVMSFIGGLPGQIMSAFVNAGSWLVQAGRDIIQGLINGVAGMIGSAVQAVQNVGGAMLDGIKGFLGIHSPSRVFRDEVGKMVGLGLLDGIGDEAINSRIDTAVNHLVSIPEDARVAGLGDHMTLVDQDGSILTRAKLIAERAADTLASQQSAAMRYARAGW